MIFGIKEKCIILPQTMYCWLLLQIIPVLLMTGFMVTNITVTEDYSFAVHATFNAMTEKTRKSPI